MFLVNALLKIGYWYKLLRLVHAYALTLEVSNCSRKLKYDDSWAKYVGAWFAYKYTEHDLNENVA